MNAPINERCELYMIWNTVDLQDSLRPSRPHMGTRMSDPENELSISMQILERAWLGPGGSGMLLARKGLSVMDKFRPRVSP